MRYIGSKDALLPAIHSLLSSKGIMNHRYRFFDAFCGTGAVANSLKDVFNIIINDSMHWSVLYSRGRITGKCCTFKKLGFDPFSFFEKNQDRIEGCMYCHYSPGKSNRMYFTPENAGRIDFMRQTIEIWKKEGKLTENEYAYLIYCLIEGVSSVSNTAGVYGAFLKHWDSRANNPIKFIKLNEDLFDYPGNNCNVESYCDKIENIIADIDCDILYLDPPYTQNQYGTQYHLLETLVLDDNPQMSKITGSRPVTPMKSMWSKDIYVQVLFDDVIANTKAKYIILSYNNDGIMSKEYIEATLKRYGIEESYSCVEIDYKKYNNFKCRGKEGHREYLFFIEKRPVNDVIYESPLNYSGSKAKMIPFIKNHLPGNINLFVDAFGGGFNVGINVSANCIAYNDINPYVVELIRSFQQRDAIEYFKALNKIIKEHNLAPLNKAEYMSLRAKYNSLPINKRSPIMLYALILFGFQQQIRFNSEHGFNIPCGSRRFNEKLVSKFMSFTRRMQEINVIFFNKKFDNLEELIAKDTFFYFDPPYRETTATYNDGKRGFDGWSIEHETQLCQFMDKISTMHGKFMLSYVIEIGEFYNQNIISWVNKNHYRIIEVPETQGRYNNRREVVITNY